MVVRCRQLVSVINIESLGLLLEEVDEQSVEQREKLCCISATACAE